jgi:hypothetical protein
MKSNALYAVQDSSLEQGIYHFLRCGFALAPYYSRNGWGITGHGLIVKVQGSLGVAGRSAMTADYHVCAGLEGILADPFRFFPQGTVERAANQQRSEFIYFLPDYLKALLITVFFGEIAAVNEAQAGITSFPQLTGNGGQPQWLHYVSIETDRRID